MNKRYYLSSDPVMLDGIWIPSEDECPDIVDAVIPCEGLLVAAEDAPNYIENDWNGHNLIKYAYHGCDEVVYDPDKVVVLDEWDPELGGHYSGGLGTHESVTQLMDGRLLLITDSDWEGVHRTARYITPEALVDHCLEVGADFIRVVTELNAVCIY